MIVALILISVVIATPLIASAQATPQIIVTRRLGSGGWYTQTNIFLGGANNTIKIPDNWNGGLVMLCRGYSPTSTDSLAPPPLRFNPNTIPMDTYTIFLAKGFATAASNYGEGGFCVKEAMIHTHQLTEYVINNYDVTGNVYLMGISMGGNVVLQLGAKYPDLYDGVLELCAPKDLQSQYTDKMFFAGIADDAALSAILFSRFGVSVPYPTPNASMFRTFCLYSGIDIAIACGGTPEEKPQAYKRISPMFSAADISIPTITVHGTKDALSPYSKSIEFMNAVAAEGHLDLYRLYKVVGGQHGDTQLTAQVSSRFDQLVNWVEYGILPPPSSL